MKRTLIVFLLVNLMLSACAPVSAPTPTPAPSATPLPTRLPPTPTATPTITPTPIPTIQVGNLSVPDPRATNPELFDLRNPDAPIPQFVNAMKMAGIKITAEQVAQGITFEQIKTKDTNLLVVAGYDLNPDPNQSGEALEGRMPLLIAKQEGRTWAWKEAFLKELAEPLDFFIGTGIGGYGFAQHYEQMVKIQTRGDFNLGLQGMGQRWNDRVTPPYPAPIFYKYLDSDVLIQQRAGMTGFGHLLLWGAAAPAWLRTGHYTREEVISIMQDSLKSDIDRYKGKILFWNVVNEVGNNDFFLQVIGPEYVELAFRIAREADPSGILIYNDYSNHTNRSQKRLCLLPLQFRMVAMSEENLHQQETQHAFLVAWGWFAQHIGLIQAIHNVPLHQKTYKHSPHTKILEFLVALLGGLPYLQDISRAAHPLDQDQAVAQAWQQPAWADYSGVSRTLSTLSMEEVQALVRAVEQVEQPLIDAELARLRQQGSSTTAT
jgi:hypothetical protein